MHAIIKTKIIDNFYKTMWNQISCNKIVFKKTLQKVSDITCRKMLDWWKAFEIQRVVYVVIMTLDLNTDRFPEIKQCLVVNNLI